MYFVEYIQNGTNISGGKSTGWMISFNRYPTTGTMVEIKFNHQNSSTDGNSFFGCSHYDGSANYFRFFTYQSGTYYIDSPTDGNARLSVPFQFGQVVTAQFTPAPNVSITNVDTQATQRRNYTTVAPNYKYPMSIWYVFDGDTGNVVEGTRVYYIKIYENNTLVMDLWPAVDNGVQGFYDKVGGQFYHNNDTTKQYVVGPTLSSILATPSKASLAASGETISIDVVTNNAWTVTGNTWLTLSSTGDTSGTTITATAPSYTGATARTDTLTFTDSVTGDEAEITIRQKYPVNGQPIYLGGDEINEIYLGVDTITEAYLGNVLVFSSGPFQGLKITPSTISFNSDSLTGEVKVKSSEAWTMTVPSWISASVLTGGTGETIVTLTATTQTASTSSTISVVSANYSASATVTFTTSRWMFIDSSNFDRSLPITKVRFYMKNVPAGTPQFSVTEGCFSELPNMNTDGTYCGLLDQAQYGYPQSHKFNMVYGGGRYTNGTTAEYQINTLPVVETGVYELTTNTTVYWSGIEAASASPVYINGNLVEVYVDYGSTPPSPTGETRTISISSIPIPPFGADGTVGQTNISVEDENQNYASLSLSYSDSYDETSYEETVDATQSFSASYVSGYFEVQGEWGDDITITYDYSNGQCDSIPEGYDQEDLSFVGDNIATSFPTPETDLECECINAGGIWEPGEGCVYPEPDPDPCIEDPCSCDPNPDECYCLQNGGEWDGSDCIYPE